VRVSQNQGFQLERPITMRTHRRDRKRRARVIGTNHSIVRSS
jgi:hypothetical protein